MIDLKQNSYGGRYSIHKPLLLLWGIGALKSRRIIDWHSIRAELSQLLMDFANDRNPKPHYPFIRLQNDGWWVVEGYEDLNGDARVSELNRVNPKARLSSSMVGLISTKEGMTSVVIELLKNFEPESHISLLDAVGIKKLAWVQFEIDASVKAYLEMLESEKRGVKYSKTDQRNGLMAGLLSIRSKTSIERRMMNISSVLADQGRQFIQGYKPYENVGPGVKPMIEEALSKYEGQGESVSIDQRKDENENRRRAKSEKAATNFSGQGFSTDADANRAVELRAMEVVREYGTMQNWGYCEDTSDNCPYDFEFRNDDLVRRVEVKGTRGKGNAVTVTYNEVEHAKFSEYNVILAVVSSIVLQRDDEGNLLATEGELRILDPWNPSTQGALKPVQYRLTLPDED
jgi:5-methylcytosine-specific restriction protein A